MGQLNNSTTSQQAFLSNTSSLGDSDIQELTLELGARREALYKMIGDFSSKICIEAQAVHDFNFQVTEYVFWSHFIFCESLNVQSTSDYEEIKEQTVAMSYLTSAIQYVPDSTDAVNHYISRFTDRFELEDKILESLSL